jgi:lactoylglutathione lyase
MDTRTAEKKAPGKPAVGKARMLHTMIRVLDLDKSIDFYTNKLGMTLSRRSDNETGRYTVAFVGYGDEKDATVVELTHNWDRKEPYDLGTAFGHLAIGVDDIYGICAQLAADGVKVPRPAGPVKGGTTVIAFIEDPDGYKIELVDRL